MIDIAKIKETDIGRLVVYQVVPGAKREQGRITSFNTRFVFVDYQNTGRGVATPPEKLNFVSE